MITSGDQHFQIIYLGNEILVLQKPPNVPLDGPYEKSVERWIFDSGLLSTSEEKPRGIKWIHQLDRPTSGILCVAFTREVASCLANCFEARSVYKEYSAIILGHLPVSHRSLRENECHILQLPIDQYKEGHQLSLPLFINVPIGTEDADPNGYLMKIYGRNNKNACTEIVSATRGYIPSSTILCTSDDENCNWIELKEHCNPVSNKYTYEAGPGNSACVIKPGHIPVTRVQIRLHSGRKHQIRVHLAQVLKQPILHDILYGGFPIQVNAETQEAQTSSFAGDYTNFDQDKTRLMLHAGKLCFPINFDAPDTFPNKRERKSIIRAHNKVNRANANLHHKSTESDSDSYPTKFLFPDDFPSIIDC
ncbi:hypothetical protein XU18_3046 [Perkinsela sp. CCAP 1560/4]|nr:hypothetical protein XU18_3046 [Perkinsela sp. CCAP 1560/4]|eukprot:KNH06109.1 hypothetical protein XU18_3046 [Perkinsela sp. CCAP 1560/4]